MEEPNVNYFLHEELIHYCDVNTLHPVVDELICTHCGLCADLCEFNALAVLPSQVMVFDELCHGCGLCNLACPAKAISETIRTLGTISKSVRPQSKVSNNSMRNLCFYEGRLIVGQAIATPIIRALKKIALEENFDHIILDLPPGASCPVVNGLSNSDFVVLVTEPTPAGEHDLNIAIQVTEMLKLPFGIVNNRSDIGDDRISRLASKNGYNLLSEIPHDNDILHYYSRGLPLVGMHERFDFVFEQLWHQITEVYKWQHKV